MNMHICFFPLSFKKYNKLDEYIHTYFFITPTFSIKKIVVRVIKKKQQTFIFLLLIKIKIW